MSINKKLRRKKKWQRQKKLLSVVLCLCMIMTTVGVIAPITASAALDTMYDGSTTTAMYFQNDTNSASVITQAHAGVGGKIADDLVYKIVTDSSKYSSKAFLQPYSGPTKESGHLKYLRSYDVLFATSDASMEWEAWAKTTADYKSQSSIGPINISPNGVTLSTKITTEAELPTSLAVNQWHNIALEFAFGDNAVDDTGNNTGYTTGSQNITIYVDGVEYPCTIDSSLGITMYGSYAVRAHFKSGTVYLDNYYDNVYTKNTDIYAEENYVVTEISVNENEYGITYDSDSKTVVLNEVGITAEALEDIISTSDTVRIYESADCETELTGESVVPNGAVLVTENTNGAFRYYTIGFLNTSDFTITANEDGETCTVTGLKTGVTITDGADVTIPETIAGLTVTAIGDGAFNTKFNANKTGVLTLPDTVKTIGAYAFYDTYVVVNDWPEALEIIGDAAFIHGGSISGDFNANLKTIGNNVFKYSSLKNPVFPEGFESIGSEPFLMCGGVKNVVLPNSIKTISDKAFSHCKGLTTFRFPQNSYITAIPGKIFCSFYPKQETHLMPDSKNLTLYIPATITEEIPDEFLSYLKDGTTVTIYGEYGSAAWDYYEKISALLADGEYVNSATDYYDSEKEKNTDADQDGNGELAALNWVEYDFDSESYDTGVNTGTESVNITQGTYTAYEDYVQASWKTSQSGVGGKLASDNVIAYSSVNGNSGSSYVSFGERVLELSVQAPADGTYGVDLVYYHVAEKNKYDSHSNLFRITSGGITINKAAYSIPITAGTWHSVAFVAPEDGKSNLMVYVDGKGYEVTLANPYYGTNRWATFNASSATGVLTTTYLDNIRKTSSMGYNAKKDTPAVLTTEATDITIADNTITYETYENATTAGELIEKLEADAAARCNIRVYEDDTYTTLLEDTDKVTDGNVVVCAATYGYSTERAYSYYTVSVPKPTAEVVIEVSDGTANVAVNGTDKGTAPGSAKYEIGSELTYTATPDIAGTAFLYWYDAVSKQILSTEETITVTVGSDAKYKGVYAYDNGYYVTFKSNGKIIVMGLSGSITAPADPYVYGYNFEGWYDSEGKVADVSLEVSEDTVYTAGFKAVDIACNVTVVDGDAETVTAYKYNEKVTVTAAGSEGQEFAYWMKDDEIVSYSQSYSFYANGDTKVTANYAEAAAEEQIILVMAQPVMVADNTKIAFYAERNVPENYTVIETGILVSKLDSFDINTSSDDMIKAKATSTARNGQYTIRKTNLTSGETWNAKAYLIYTDGTDTYTIYSNMVSMPVE